MAVVRLLYHSFFTSMNLSAIISSLIKLGRAIQYGSRPNPTRDWMVLLAVFLATFIGSVAWSTFYFMSVTSGEDSVDVSRTTSQEEIKPSVRVEQVFTERARQALQYQGADTFVDPSR